MDLKPITLPDLDSVSVYTDETYDDHSTRTADIYDDMTDTSLYFSSDDDNDDLDLDPEATPVALDDRFVFDLPSPRTHLAASDASTHKRTRRSSSLSKSFKKARKRVESFGHDASGTRGRLNSAGNKLRHKMEHLKHKAAKSANRTRRETEEKSSKHQD